MSKVKKFSKNQKEIVFFGTSYSSNNIIQINKLRKELFEFNPDILLVEGGFEKSKFKNEKEAILYGEELGFASHYAKENNILLEGNDPLEVECIEFLKSMYNKDFSFLYFVLRNLNFFLKNKVDIPKQDKAKMVIEQFKRESEWGDYDFSFENFEKIFEKHFGIKFNYLMDYDDYFSSLSNEKETNNATRKLNKFRNIYTMRKIMESVLTFNKIFIVKGCPHLSDCESLLENIFE
jgi:hypothetical protein